MSNINEFSVEEFVQELKANPKQRWRVSNPSLGFLTELIDEINSDVDKVGVMSYNDFIISGDTLIISYYGEGLWETGWIDSVREATANKIEGIIDVLEKSKNDNQPPSSSGRAAMI